ncbi:Transmembrane 9 superfamily member 9, partial [Frankliniella fusca]
GCGPPSPRLRVPDTSGRVTQPKLRAPPGCGSPSAMLRVGYLAGTSGWPSGLRQQT